jgi:hypothetical protein
MSPEQQKAQRENALENANRIRSYRAGVKQLVAEAKLQPDEVLVCGDPKLHNMAIEQLLVVVPGLGKTGRRRMLGRGLIPATTTIEDLTARQRGYLLVQLRRHREVSVVWRRKLAEWGGDQLVG